MNIEKENVIKNKNEAIRLLNNYLDTCISTDNKHLKKANLISYWHSDFNELSIYDVRAGSEKTAIFITKSKKCVPVKICNITMTLKNNINLDINKYLENVLSRIHNSLN